MALSEVRDRNPLLKVQLLPAVRDRNPPLTVRPLGRSEEGKPQRERWNK